MSRYRFSCTVDDAHMSSLVATAAGAGQRANFDPEITMSLMPEFKKTEPDPGYQWTNKKASTEAEPKAKRPARRAIRRVHAGNGANWPAEGSIYDVALKAIQTGPQTAAQLRDALKAGGFSPQSVNSAMVRLKKAEKAKMSPEGWVAA